MVPRGEVGLIVAMVGLQMNIVSEAAYALVIFMTAATILFGPPILKLLFRDDFPSDTTAMGETQESAM